MRTRVTNLRLWVRASGSAPRTAARRGGGWKVPLDGALGRPIGLLPRNHGPRVPLSGVQGAAAGGGPACAVLSPPARWKTLKFYNPSLAGRREGRKLII